MIKAVIFDMDGLLVDSEPVWDRARKSMADGAAKPWTADDHKALMGVSTAEWADYMIEHLELDMTREEVVDEVVERMIALYREGVPYLPGAIDAVELAGAHYRTALASGSHPALIEAVMADDAMRGKFEIIVSGDEVARGKPAPDVYLETARRLGVEPEECVCLEDSGNGIRAGANAGMRVIAVPDARFHPAGDAAAVADVVLGSLTELTPEHFSGS